MDNANRSIFSLDGITGMLIATALLLSILAGLTMWAISAQQQAAQQPYKITDPQAIKMRDTANANLVVVGK